MKAAALFLRAAFSPAYRHFTRCFFASIPICALLFRQHTLLRTAFRQHALHFRILSETDTIQVSFLKYMPEISESFQKSDRF